VLGKLIENWWTNSTERTFQFQFATLCHLRGERVVHLTRHCSSELGRDLITVSKDNIVNLYQLKTCKKRLGLSVWRKEISDQISDLVYNKCNHPSIPSEAPQNPTLVLNGDIEEEVQNAINERNLTSKANCGRTLRVMVKGDLVHETVKHLECFWPTDPKSSALLLKLCLREGTELFDRELFADLLETSLAGCSSREMSVRTITFLPLLTALATQNDLRKANSASVIEAWSMCMSYVLAINAKYKSARNVACNTIELIEEIVELQMKQLAMDVIENPELIVEHYDSAVQIANIRMTITRGLLSTYLVSGQVDEEICALVEKALALLDSQKGTYPELWGESAVPYFLSFYFSLTKRFANNRSDKELVNLVNELLAKLTEDNLQQSFTNPFASPEISLKLRYLKQLTTLDERRLLCNGKSYWLAPLVDLLVLNREKSELRAMWDKIPTVHTVEFQTVHPSDKFRYLNEHGVTAFHRYPDHAKWTELMTDVHQRKGAVGCLELPFTPYRALLFLIVFPHRVTQDLVLQLQNSINRSDIL
jgi:hypothetical protein